ncbi:MAG TPA: ferric enterobactin receptor, partial [Cytophagales bacterium]|nr:ferric enterobactin receptor [Cytophagales bacterium]
IGFTTQEVAVPSSNYVAVVLQSSAEELQEIVVSTGRGSQRTFADTPLPVDNLTAKELSTTGQPSFDKALQYRVPSFNTVMTPVNDATSLLDPYEIRNMGPSRTLILINGKRKNLSSLVYTQTSPGRGETGADLSAIPQDAIKRVEILRDGASAQYGSDAIAGVMNIILKDNFDGPTLRLTTGISQAGDGGNYSINYNSGAKIGNKGFINYHVSFLRQQRMVRNSKVSLAGETDPVVGLTGNDAQSVANAQAFLTRFPDAKNQNASADNTSAKFLINMGIPLSDNTEFYANAAYVYRKALSFANYRTPYWKLDYGLLHTPDPTVGAPNYTGDNELAPNSSTPLYAGYIGYQPTMDGDLNDYNGTVGIRSTNNGWKQDMSLTVGGNKMLFSVNNTVNHDLKSNSPINFKPGGFAFRHIVGNIDISKQVTSRIFMGFGSEFRSETWQQIAGDTASYSGQGANSFPGYPQKNAITASRFNIGGYADFGFDITDAWYVGVTGRSEKYSDFGNANVGKISSRLKLFEDKLSIRSSFSNGFRAPTLAQQYLSLNQASFQNGTIVIQGLANNVSREAHLLGVPKLKAEQSINFTAGLGFNPNKNLTVTLDYYYIDVKDRIVYSSKVGQGVSAQLDALLQTVGSTGISFFINGVHTTTKGLDLVGSYHNISIGENTLNLNFAGNYTIANDLVGSPTAPPLIANAGGRIFTPTEQALMLTSRPKYKYIIGADFIVGKFNFYLNNTVIGPTKFSNVDLSDFDGSGISRLNDLQVTFDTRVLTDLSIGFKMTDKATLTLTASNIFNLLPQYHLKAISAAGSAMLAGGVDTRDGTTVDQIKNAITFNNRYPYTSYDGSQFSQFGATYLAQLLYRF